MKFMEKYAAWITAAILGIIAITFSALFFVTKNDLNNLEKATDHLYGGKQIRIIAFTGTDNPATADTDERVKIMDEIYITSKNERTLDDLMKNKSGYFRYTNHADYGMYLSGVKNTTTGNFEDAPGGMFWRMLTPSYYNDTFSKDQYDNANFTTWTSGVNFDGSRYIGTETLAGATGLHLFQDQIFSLNLTAYGL